MPWITTNPEYHLVWGFDIKWKYVVYWVPRIVLIVVLAALFLFVALFVSVNAMGCLGFSFDAQVTAVKAGLQGLGYLGGTVTILLMTRFVMDNYADYRTLLADVQTKRRGEAASAA
jgi:hypothetical protein